MALLLRFVMAGAGLALLFLQAACQTAPASAHTDVGDTAFVAFEGEQRPWPVSPNALVETGWSLPVYREFPARPYRILGRVIGTQQHVIGRAFALGLWSDRDRLRDICAQAARHGADAVLLTQDPEMMELLRVPKGEAGEKESPLFDFQGAVVAIQWVDR